MSSGDARHDAADQALGARGQRIRELLYHALVYAEIPASQAAAGATVLAQVIDSIAGPDESYEAGWAAAVEGAVREITTLQGRDDYWSATPSRAAARREGRAAGLREAVEVLRGLGSTETPA